MSPSTAGPPGSSPSLTLRERQPPEAITAQRRTAGRPVMLSGDNRQTAERIAHELG
jgi:cation transport ATPase